MINFTSRIRHLPQWAPALLACCCTAWLATASAQAQTTPTQAQAQADSLRFDILEFVVEGNTVLSTAAIEQAVYPFLGERKTIADAEAARQALEKLYQDAGYLSVAVELPPQSVGAASGELKLVVTEARLGEVRVSDARYNRPSLITAGLPSLKPGTVPNFQDMQEELGALNRRGTNRDITPLVTSGDQDGSINVDLKVQDALPLHGRLELNSKQSANTQRNRLEANVSYDNLFQRQHSLGLSWVYSPWRPSESNVLSMTYQLPVGDRGDRVFALISNSNSDTPTSLGGATVSRGQTYDLRWRHPITARGSYSHALTWNAAYKHAKDRNQDVAGFTTETPALRYPTVGVAYDLTDVGDITGRVTTFEAGLSLSASGLSQRQVACADGVDIDQFECKRAGASASFQVFKLNASHREPLFKQWSLYAQLQGQWASGPLVSGEQAVLGGVDSVRGYFEGEQAGDNSLLLRVEFSAPTWTWSGQNLTALAFVDRAQLMRLDALPGEARRTQLGSTGLGLRLDGPAGLRASLDWARVIFDTPLSGSSAGRSHRTELSVSQSF